MFFVEIYGESGVSNKKIDKKEVEELEEEYCRSTDGCYYCGERFGAFNYFPTANFLICTKCEKKMAKKLKKVIE